MNNINYVLFEIIKYKIEFNEFLEYGLPTYQMETDDIKTKYDLLKSTYEAGVYKDILTSLFTNYDAINQPLKMFLSKYSSRKILKMIKSKKLKNLLKYNKLLIDCNETFNHIIKTFENEEELSKLFNKDILKLLSISNDYFSSFLFFNSYHTYIDCTLNNNSQIKFNKNTIKELVSIINYCNMNGKYQNYIDIIINNEEKKLNDEIEKLSNECISLDQKKNDILKKLANSINNDLEKSKK